MKDVASMAGYHPSTVSLALRGDRRISIATREVIAEAARSLGYRKNPMVSAWVSSRRYGSGIDPHVSLAFLIEGGAFNERANIEVFRAASSEAKKRGYYLTLFDLEDYRRNLRRLDQVLKSRGVQGILVGEGIEAERLRALDLDAFAWVALGHARSSLSMHRVDEDHVIGIEQRIQVCVERGADRFGLVLDTSSRSERQKFWLAGFLCAEAVQKHINDPTPVFFWDGQSNDALFSWLSENDFDTVLSDCDPPEMSSEMRWLFLRDPNENDRSGTYLNALGLGRAALRQLVELTEQNQRGLPSECQTLLVDPGVVFAHSQNDHAIGNFVHFPDHSHFPQSLVSFDPGPARTESLQQACR